MVQDKLWELLLVSECMDCGISDPRVLEFDHLRDKKDNVSNLLNKSNWTTIENEIKKCEIVCANCHRIRTQDRSGSWRSSMPL